MTDDKKKVVERPNFEYYPDFMDTETTGQKLLRVAKETPYVLIALAGGLGILGHGLYNIRNRGMGRPISQYLIHYRVYVQGFMVATAVIGITLESVINYYYPPKDINDIPSPFAHKTSKINSNHGQRNIENRDS